MLIPKIWVQPQKASNPPPPGPKKCVKYALSLETVLLSALLSRKSDHADGFEAGFGGGRAPHCTTFKQFYVSGATTASLASCVCYIYQNFECTYTAVLVTN